MICFVAKKICTVVKLHNRYSKSNTHQSPGKTDERLLIFLFYFLIKKKKNANRPKKINILAFIVISTLLRLTEKPILAECILLRCFVKFSIRIDLKTYRIYLLFHSLLERHFASLS